MAAESVAEYCREIETYLCRKNDGHLIRITGPSFDLVTGWATQGVPLKVALAGIDRCFERYYRQGPRRRPVKIDFCDADVLDVFDEWRRAVGVVTQSPIQNQSPIPNPKSKMSGPSLPEHLERVVLRLSAARASDAVDATFDELIDRVAQELDAARAAKSLRGAARRAAIERLAALDAELLKKARATVDERTLMMLAREADEELAAFRAGMAADVYPRAREAAIDRLIRERFGLPTIAFVS